MDEVKSISRAGFSLRGLLLILASLALLQVVGGALWPTHDRQWSDGPLTSPVFRGEFLHEISANGTIESAENVEVCCDVSAWGFSSTRILQLVPEGTYVEPGDFLVRFDSAPLEELRKERELRCFDAQAWLVQAQKAYELASITRKEYLEGTYRQQKQNLDAALATARYRFQRADEYHRQSKTLYDRGYVSEQELSASKFAAQKTQLELELATTRHETLVKYTRQRTLRDLECRVITTRARLDAARFRYEKNRGRLAELDEEIEKCLVTAPSAGQVVYAHLHHNGHSHMIEEGAPVRRDQVVIRLPDAKHMQLKAMISENDVAEVAEGMSVRVALKAYPGVELTGRVRHVKEFPEPEQRFGSSVKQFETVIALDPNDLDLRPGLSAEASICAERLPRQLLVPTQAVLAYSGKDYCITCDGGHWQSHEVTTGSNNGRYVVIRTGLDEGTQVVLATDTYRRKAGLASPEPRS